MAEITNLSHSTIDTMLSCPKKHQLRKVIRVQQRPAWALIGGSAFHSATQELDEALYRESNDNSID